jgi:hypothetical protein
MPKGWVIMHNFIIDALTVTPTSSAEIFTPEWECATLVSDNAEISAASLTYWFSYMSYFNSNILSTTAWRPAPENGVFTSLWYAISALTGTVLAALGFQESSLMLKINPLLNASIGNIFANFAQISEYALGGIALGATPALFNVSSTLWLDIALRCDPLLVVTELATLAVLAAAGANLLSAQPTSNTFYDDVATFCKANNLALTEIATFLSLALGFLIFDIFSCAVEEDITDVFFFFMFVFVIALFFFLLVNTDVQYFYMVSSASSGDLTARAAAFDAVNNFLCILRIFFCW